MSGAVGARPDLRVDRQTGTRTYVVGSRQDRPNLPSVECPFCPGQEGRRIEIAVDDLHAP